LTAAGLKPIIFIMVSTKKTNTAKKKPTREKILEAAIQVFSDYPFYSASIRMIGKAAKIDHPLVSYHFPTKAVLFEEVIEHVTNEFYQANILWLEGLEGLHLATGFDLYLDRFIEFSVNHPSALRIITLNLVQSQEHEDIPGYKRLRDFFARCKQTLKQNIPLQGDAHDIEMLLNNFNVLAINYLGGGTYYARILGLEPGSPQYLKWVKQTMTFAFLPRFKQMTRSKKKG
jgi:AcrR family transcriptional regulator